MLRRLIFLGLAAAEYFRVSDSPDSYLGIINDNIAVVSGSLATDFTRLPVANTEHLTRLSLLKQGFIFFRNEEAKFSSSAHTNFMITMAENGYFLLISNDSGTEKCMYVDGPVVKRGDCSMGGQFTFFELHRAVLPRQFEENTILKAGWIDGPDVPIDELAYSWADLTPDQKESVLQPYARRIRGPRDMIHLPTGRDYNRVFRKHPIL